MHINIKRLFISGASGAGVQVAFSRNSLSTSGVSPSEAVKKSPISFTPDFSAVVRDDCTYLEITAQTYLLAYKSTLISKGSRSREQIPHRFTVANLRALKHELQQQQEHYYLQGHEEADPELHLSEDEQQLHLLFRSRRSSNSLQSFRPPTFSLMMV